MARKTVVVMVSDVSGLEIHPQQYAKVVITNGSSRYTLDASLDEVGELMSKARKSKRAGRKAKVA